MSEAAWQDAFDTDTGMRHYDAVLVPRMLEPWAELLLDELDLTDGEAVLDVACGPGTVTRLAADRVGPTGRVTGCDLSPVMLAIAKEKPVRNGAAPIEYVECPADALAVADDSFDVIVCQQGLQFFPDRVGSMAEMARAARYGARVGIACWAEVDDSPAFAGIARAVGAVLGADAQHLYESGPWGLPDAGELLGLVHGAGFASARVVRRMMPVTFDGGVDELCHTLGLTPVGGLIAGLDDAGRNDLFTAIEAEIDPLMVDGQIRTETVSHIVVRVGDRRCASFHSLDLAEEAAPRARPGGPRSPGPSPGCGAARDQ